MVHLISPLVWQGSVRDICITQSVIVSDILACFLFKVFDTQIQPIIDYGSEVCYGSKRYNRLETLHLSYLKRELGVKLQPSICPFSARQDDLWWDKKSFLSDTD